MAMKQYSTRKWCKERKLLNNKSQSFISPLKFLLFKGTHSLSFHYHRKYLLTSKLTIKLKDSDAYDLIVVCDIYITSAPFSGLIKG